MRILFLDFDGVINSERTRLALGGLPQDFRRAERAKFDPVAIALIARLCRHSQVSIVLSSSWRTQHSVAECAEALDLPIIDRTPDFWDEAGTCRGDEIQAWLDAHPDVTHYAILDDMATMLESQQDHFVRTDPQNGLSYGDYQRLQCLLSTDLYALETA